MEHYADRVGALARRLGRKLKVAATVSFVATLTIGTFRG